MTETTTLAKVKPQEIEHFDVVIVGAGISGVGGAYNLTKQCPGMSFVKNQGHRGRQGRHYLSDAISP
jgi:ribulose 1,5-bisphosphate synthetase/thiazole synthase